MIRHYEVQPLPIIAGPLLGWARIKFLNPAIAVAVAAVAAAVDSAETLSSDPIRSCCRLLVLHVPPSQPFCHWRLWRSDRK